MAWKVKTQTERDARDAKLREQLLKKNALFGVRVMRAWFDWRAERLKNKYAAVWKISPAGAAFRAWQSLVDVKARREFLEWALGPDMVVIQNKLNSATKVVSEELSEQLGELRDSIEGVRATSNQDALHEKKTVRELLELKMDKEGADAQRAALEHTAGELDALRTEIASQAETQRNLSLESERGVNDLSQQIATLSRDVEDRVAQAKQALDNRVGQEEKALGAVSQELQTIKSTKANHEELVKLVQKLQHRPKPGMPMAVQQLLAVPYPMPPGNMRAKDPSLRSRSIASAGPGARSSGAFSQMSKSAGAELRDVPTTLPDEGEGGSSSYRPFLATSEQILVRPLPADAVPFDTFSSSMSGQFRVNHTNLTPPPSSHTPVLSARVSPTVNAILHNRRPASARQQNTGGGPAAQIGVFASRTERLEMSLGERGGEEVAGAVLPEPDTV